MEITEPTRTAVTPTTNELRNFIVPEVLEEETKFPTLQVIIQDALLDNFVLEYKEDPYFKEKWEEAGPDINTRVADKHFFKGEDGLLFFRDADWTARLIVPRNLV